MLSLYAFAGYSVLTCVYPPQHIQYVVAQLQGNVSSNARALNMHRRTLQPRLAKKPVMK